ncbi:lysosomal alpha-glucosidase-like [Xenia sp. Carnegie-2017]|uniref:lysosomal alpha-glucosidase-like n=1 Tax=Xenia sp. Carnegie-2017 TaxID=2897299 RepID=UPI001F036F45|nr:lysosomal alpha-glucosidase-like [Xenia sp. Carnegie-2017]
MKLFAIITCVSFFFDKSLSSADCRDDIDSKRFDCYPENGASQEKCEIRGCCWKVATNKRHEVTVPLNVPYCFYPKNFGYRIVNEQETATGILLDLQMQQPGPYGADVENLRVNVDFETENRVHVKIYDPNEKRYEVPIETPKVAKKSSKQNYLISFTKYPFGFSVTRKSTGRVLFNSTAGAMIFEDQFLQISSFLPSTNIYGLGEHVDSFRLNVTWQKLVMFARDGGGTPFGGINLYGTHPFYVNIEPDGNANGVFLLNSNAMEVILQPTPAITYRTIGGILDFYIFLGPEPDLVVQQYTEVIGRPFMPPYWSLGFHLCRWGYMTSNRTQAIVNKMRQYGIPQDVQWNDIEYANHRFDFTVNPKTFGGLPELVDDLHKHNQHYIPITDPGIPNSDPNYAPYVDGLKIGAFVLKPDKDEPLVGKVWPGNTVFPDFFNPDTIGYWQDQLQKFHRKVSFDGLWIDMNEPSNFVDGSTTGCEDSKYESPPYVPGIMGGFLTSKTICMGARHSNGIHYNLHSLYGHSELIATSRAIQNILRKRTLVISRSTYPSSGKYGGHWLGDNKSLWPDMGYSISGILDFNLFGIPMVGADICGFNGNTQVELCKRWLELGAFYPFSRNHNTKGTIAQDPVSLGDDVAAIARKTFLIRYSLLPYLYTLFYKAHVFGSTVARSLVFEFPKDPNTYSIQAQFLWGSALLISPVLTEGSTQVEAYFLQMCDAPIDKINLHIRGGFILPMQEPSTTTAESRRNNFYIIAALSSSGSAIGDLYLDDGESLDPKETLMVQFSVQSHVLTSSPSFAGYTPSAKVANITVLGVNSSNLSQVLVNGDRTPFQFDNSSKILRLPLLSLSLVKKFLISWH